MFSYENHDYDDSLWNKLKCLIKGHKYKLVDYNHHIPDKIIGNPDWWDLYLCDCCGKELLLWPVQPLEVLDLEK